MLTAIAALFAAEGRPGGDEVAATVRDLVPSITKLPTPRGYDIETHVKTALSLRPHACAAKVSAVLPLIDWHHSGYEDGRIRPEIALHMLTAELIGPTGMIPCAQLRMGLFMQSPHVDYVTRRHLAEETFIMLGGTGYWSTHGGRLSPAGAGDIIFHPSMTPHATVTKAEPLIAAWRWSGDISWGGYELTG